MKSILYILLLNTIILTCQAQDHVKFESTIATGLFPFHRGIVDIDPGPNWKGDYLPHNDKTGFRVGSINGVCVKNLRKRAKARRL